SPCGAQAPAVRFNDSRHVAPRAPRRQLRAACGGVAAAPVAGGAAGRALPTGGLAHGLCRGGEARGRRICEHRKLLARMATVSKENDTALLAELPSLVSDLQSAHTSLSQVDKDIKASEAESMDLYDKMLEEEGTDATKQLVSNLKHADKQNFKNHHRLAESFNFKFKKAIHLIAKGQHVAKARQRRSVPASRSSCSSSREPCSQEDLYMYFSIHICMRMLHSRPPGGATSGATTRKRLRSRPPRAPPPPFATPRRAARRGRAWRAGGRRAHPNAMCWRRQRSAQGGAMEPRTLRVHALR
ncbi:unnamed protein product, partial [Prorocentrum cordatum]